MSLPTDTYATDNDQLYEGKRDEMFKDDTNWLTIQSSEGGTRFVTADGQKEVMLIDNFGGIYLNGDLYLNNEKVNETLSNTISSDAFQIGFVIILVFFIVFLLVTVFVFLKLKRKIGILENHIKRIV
ncbi:hypothetical protein NV377_21195 [Paenibacillus sp. T3-5-0-4]|nr:hypothetical protein [Paenibacillus endoradicis]